jgi:hypothetical protein
MAGASRTELLQWLNEPLRLNYPKIEQCGAGGAYLQILDSIYGDIPMARVKMQARRPCFILRSHLAFRSWGIRPHPSHLHSPHADRIPASPGGSSLFHQLPSTLLRFIVCRRILRGSPNPRRALAPSGRHDPHGGAVGRLGFIVYCAHGAQSYDASDPCRPCHVRPCPGLMAVAMGVGLLWWGSVRPGRQWVCPLCFSRLIFGICTLVLVCSLREPLPIVYRGTNPSFLSFPCV